MVECDTIRDRLTRYIEGELEAGEVSSVEAHLARCPACSSFVRQNRALEALFGSTRTPPADEGAAFLDSLRRRLESDEASSSDAAGSPSPGGGAVSYLARKPEHSRLRRLFPALTAAAAAAILLISFFLLEPDRDPLTDDRDSPAGTDQVARTTEDGDSVSPPTADDLGPAIGSEARRLARERFSAVLDSLAQVTDFELWERFESELAPLRADGWHLEVLLSGSLRREHGESLRSAIRLISRAPDPGALYNVIPALSRCRAEGIHATEALHALAHLGGPRAERGIARALDSTGLRETALELLASMPGASAAHRIYAHLQRSGEITGRSVSPFAALALRELAARKDPGVDGLIELYAVSEHSPALARVLSPPPTVLRQRLMARLNELSPTEQSSGLKLAAAWRLEEALPLLAAQARRRTGGLEAPALIATVGGTRAVVTLVGLYEEPFSLREREGLCRALGGIFALHPGETDPVLRGALVALDEAKRESLVAMLSAAEPAEASHALGWLVENSTALAPEAALALARTGSDVALEVLMALLDDQSLPASTWRAVAAAAIFLGGDEALETLRAGSEARSAFSGMSRGASGRQRRSRAGETLTETKFFKLQALLETTRREKTGP